MSKKRKTPMTYLPPKTSTSSTVTTPPSGSLVVLSVNGQTAYITPANLLASGSGTSSGTNSGTATPTAHAESADGTKITTTGPAIYDAGGNAFTLGNAVSPQTGLGIYYNGAYVSPTGNVVEGDYIGHAFYQKNSAGAFYKWNGTAFAAAPDPTASAGTTTAPPASGAAGISTPVRGVNLSGMEFGSNVPGSVGADYLVGQEEQITYWTAKGVKIFRLPFLWERIQPTMGGALNGACMAYIDTVVNAAINAGCFIILDMHQYMRYTVGGAQYIIGETAQATAANYADVWGKLAARYKAQPKVIFELMNEPHDLNLTTLVSTYNAAIAAIRAAGAANMIMLDGTAYTGAQSWVSSGNGAAMLNISDSANNYVFDVHQYLDPDGSGINTTCVVGSGASRMQPFTDWARANGKRGFLGETDFAANTQCYTEANALFTHIKNNADVYLGWTYWSAGFWPADNPLTVQPDNINNPVDKPQVATLVSYFP